MKKMILTFCAGLAGVAFSAIDTTLFPHRITVQFAGCTSLTAQENFPVVIKLAEGQPYGFSYADCAVDSFRFTDIEGNVLPHDVETWNTEGTSYVWVNVPSLVKDQVIFFRYGAAAASLPANTPTEVWTKAGYVGVWHMAEASGAVADAAGNGLTATHLGTVPATPAVSGVIGTARCTAGSSRGYLSVPSYDALGLGATFTISGWVRQSAANGYSRVFSRKATYTDDNGWEVEMSNGSSTSFSARAAKNDKYVSGAFPNLTTDWRLLALAYDGNSLNVFGDGALVKSGTVTSNNPDNGKPLSFGCDSDGNEAHLQGAYDEVRLRRTASTAEWLAMEYESARTANFAVLSAVDQEMKNTIGATAAEGGQVRIGEEEAAAAVQSESVDLGESLTVTLTAVATNGFHFISWTGNLDKIVSGDRFSSTITVTTTLGASLTANFVSKSGSGYIEVTNAFDHPSGGFMTSDFKAVPGSVFSNRADVVIAFTAPDDAPAGLRELIYNGTSTTRTTGLTDDWGHFPNFDPGTSATTQTGVQYAETTKTGLAGDYATCTYAGSWYVPAAATYSFRMFQAGRGQLVIDNQIILQQKTNGKAVTTNGVALASGWHNLYIVLLAKSQAIGPVDTTGGLLYSAANADLAADPTAGVPFATESGEGGHRLSTAFNGVFVPSLWAEGGDVILDCANALGDVRLAGQWGSLNHSFALVNMPSGRTLEVGRPSRMASTGYQALDSFAYIDWSRTTLPAGVPVRLMGLVAQDAALAAGHVESIGKRVTLATTVPDFFGVVASGATDFSFPDGLVELTIGNPSVLGGTAKIHVGANQSLGMGGGAFFWTNTKGLPRRFGTTIYTFHNDIEVLKSGSVNMTPAWDGASIYADKFTGAGTVCITGWGRRMILAERIDVGGLTAGQRGDRIMFRPPVGAEASHVGTLTLSGESSAQPSSGWDYFGAALFYCPQGPDEAPLAIDTVSAGGALWAPGQSKMCRSGATLTTCSNNTVNVSVLKGIGLQLRTVIPGTSSADPVEGGNGPANFVIGSIDAAMTLYISSNVNITVTNVAKATAFHYEVMSNGVNAAVLDIEGTCTASTLSATDIAMLPARVKGFVGDVTLTETETKTYPVTVDFARAAPVLGGCDGSGTLVAAPANGSIDVTLAGDEPSSGDYGLARFTSGGDLLSSWTVSAPTFYKGHSVAVVKDETGLWLKVRKGGVTIFIR